MYYYYYYFRDMRSAWVEINREGGTILLTVNKYSIAEL